MSPGCFWNLLMASWMASLVRVFWSCTCGESTLFTSGFPVLGVRDIPGRGAEGVEDDSAAAAEKNRPRGAVDDKNEGRKKGKGRRKSAAERESKGKDGRARKAENEPDARTAVGTTENDSLCSCRLLAIIGRASCWRSRGKGKWGGKNGTAGRVGQQLRMRIDTYLFAKKKGGVNFSFFPHSPAGVDLQCRTETSEGRRKTRQEKRSKDKHLSLAVAITGPTQPAGKRAVYGETAFLRGR